MNAILINLIAISFGTLDPLIKSLCELNLSEEYPHDIETISELMDLYNQRIVEAEAVERPTGYITFVSIIHQGVLIRTEMDAVYLIHHGSNYGISQDAVIVDAKHMSTEWVSTASIPINGVKTVSGAMKAAGGNGNEEYDIIFNNCYHASHRVQHYLTG
jgi:hypothetical protein